MSYMELPAAPGHGPVSQIKFSEPADNTLFVGKFDNSVLLYNCSRRTLVASLQSPSPVLSVAHSSYKTTFTGLLDGTIRHVDYENMAFSVPIVEVASASENTTNGVNHLCPMDLATFAATTYGGVVLIFDPRSLRLPHQQQTNGKIFAMDTTDRLITVGKSQLAVEIYDVRKMAAPILVRATGLRFQVTALRNFPSNEGYALSSVDGRVSVEYYDELEQTQAQKFAFKCHRTKDKEAGEDIVNAVTGLSFHPKHGTLFTSGADGNVCVWNWAKRKRMKLFARDEDQPQAISHMDLSGDGEWMAIATTDDAYTRATSVGSVAPSQGKLLVRQLSDADCKPKS